MGDLAGCCTPRPFLRKSLLNSAKCSSSELHKAELTKGSSTTTDPAKIKQCLFGFSSGPGGMLTLLVINNEMIKSLYPYDNF